MFDARALHAWLGHKREFAKWISGCITEFGFEEGSDFSSQLTKTRGRPRIDYRITLDMAKELAMIERTERGRQTRRYFIEMEKVHGRRRFPNVAHTVFSLKPPSC